MKRGMSLETLLDTVVKQREAKRDFVASTKESIRMVDAEDQPGSVAIVLLKEGADSLERFSVTENCHRQIASRLQVPWKYYDRLLNDHRDLVIHQVNALFEREPNMRLLRTLDGRARAFLSDRYRPLDNDAVLEQTLPPIVKGDIASKLLSSNVSDDKLYMKVLFTDDRLKMDVGEAPHSRLPADRPGHTWDGGEDMRSGRDVVRPGCIISNSETGNGSLNIRGFFWRAFCDNGCLFGLESVFDYSRRHVGAKLVGNGDFEVFSDETRRKDDELTVAQVADAMTALTSRENVQRMAETFRRAKQSEKVGDAFAAVDQLAREVPVIREGDKESIIANFLRDQDFSQWGLLNAVTEVANRDDVDYERACELEQAGASILNLNAAQWKRVAMAEKVAA